MFSLEHRQDTQIHEHKGHSLALSMCSRQRKCLLEARSGSCMITRAHQGDALESEGVDQTPPIFQRPRKRLGFFSHWCEPTGVILIPHQ